MYIVKISLLFLLFFLSKHSFATATGECTFSNQKLSYSGANLPSWNEEYRNGEVLGKITLSANYNCRSYQAISYYSRNVLEIGSLDARHSYLGSNRFESNVEGIVFESSYVRSNNGQPNELHLIGFNQNDGYTTYHRISGTLNVPLFDVIKSGKIIADTSVSLNLNQPFYLATHFQSTTSAYPSYKDSISIPDTLPVPVYNSSCNLTYPPNVTIPPLSKGRADEVNTLFDITLNCDSPSMLQNNVQLTVTPINMESVTLQGDKSSLLFVEGGVAVSMKMFTNVEGTEEMIKFSTMYEFNNGNGGNSFTFPMRAQFQIEPSSNYGNFNFSTQILVGYN